MSWAWGSQLDRQDSRIQRVINSRILKCESLPRSAAREARIAAFRFFCYLQLLLAAFARKLKQVE